MASQAVGAGLGVASQIIGGILAQRQQSWQNDAIANVLNELKQAYGTNQQLGFNYLDPQRDQLLKLTGNLGAGLFDSGDLYGLLEKLRGFGGEITPQAFQQAAAGYGGLPGYEDQLNNLTGLQSIPNSIYGALEGILSSGGQDPRYGDLYDRLMDIGLGRGQALDSMQDIGTELLSGRGRTNLSSGVQDRALDTLNTGGWGNVSELLFGKGGGLAARGEELAGREALLPLEMRAGMARDAAGSQAWKAAQNFRRKAALKGGGPETRGGGSRNEAMLEFEDMLLGAESDALRNALTDQQGLQLQQMGQGFSGAGTGLGAAGTSQQLATQLQQVLGQLGLGGGELENSRMGLGGNLSEAYNQLRLQGLQGAQSPLTQQFGNLFQAGGLMNQTYGANQDQFSRALQAMLGGGQLGLQGLQGYFDTQGQSLGQQASYLNNLLAPYMQGLGELGNTGRSFLSLTGTSLAGMPGLLGSAPSGSALGSTLSNMGQGIGQGISQWLVKNVPGFKGGGSSGLSQNDWF